MKCQKCPTLTRVLYTTDTKRRRICPACEHRFTTYEFSAAEVNSLRAQSVRFQRIKTLANEVVS